MGMAFNGFRPAGINPNQRYGDGSGPMGGPMSLSSGSSPLPAIDALPPIQPTTWQKGGKGWNTVGGIGDVLAALGGRETPYTNANMELQKQQQMLERQMMLARYKQQNPDPTGTMQNVAASGVQQGTPEYQALMRKVLLQPHYMVLGNPESGQQVIDANNPPQDAGPPPEAVAHLRSDPSLASQFDEVFGPGAAVRAMGGQ